MCVQLEGTEDLEAVAIRFNATRTMDELSSGLVRPTDRAPTLLFGEDQRRLGWMRWGWNVPVYDRKSRAAAAGDEPPKERTRLQHHARRETARTKQLWSESYARRRCAIVVGGWWELEEIPGQKRGGRPHYLTAGELIPLAALWRREGDVARFALLTADPPRELLHANDRMPVVLTNDGLGRWLDPRSDPGALAELGEVPGLPIRSWPCVALGDPTAT